MDRYFLPKADFHTRNGVKEEVMAFTGNRIEIMVSKNRLAKFSTGLTGQARSQVKTAL